MPRWTGWTEGDLISWSWLDLSLDVEQFPISSPITWLGGEGSSLHGELWWIHTYPGVLLLSAHAPASGPIKPTALDLGRYAGFLELSMVN